jgi:hypothetical protein
VLDDGIRTVDDFAAWLAQHGRAISKEAD